MGQTYPVQDLAVEGEQLTVSFDQPSSFEVEPGQKDVCYQLYEGDNPVQPPCSAVGTGEETAISGPIITKDKVFRILASKIDRLARNAFLFETAAVKVGLNTALRTWFPNLPRLHPDITNPSDSDPCIADYGSSVEVRVASSQLGARYQLSYVGRDGVEILTRPADGTGSDLSLFTDPMEEDAQIRVVASRTFDPSEGRPDLREFLGVVLTLAVRANPSLNVSVDGTPLVDPTAPAAVTIAASQPSATYRAYVRTLVDASFEIDASPGADLLTVSVPASLDVAAHDVFVHNPPWFPQWQDLQGFGPQGEPVPGTGGNLTITLGPLHEDSIVVIQAWKSHPAVMPGESAVPLKQAIVILARPDAVPGLALDVSPDTDGASGAMLVSNGQRGVFYYFRQVDGADPIGLPAYFHRLDEQGQTGYRGVGQLRIGMDFVIARLPPPDSPIVDIAPLPPNGRLSVNAVWARTGVDWAAPRTITVSIEKP
jgi:hypothetical protein